MKHLRRLLQLIKLVLRDFAGCNQLAHLLLRVALKRRLELLKLLHHLLEISQRSGHLPAAERVKQWVHPALPPSSCALPALQGVSLAC